MSKTSDHVSAANFVNKLWTNPVPRNPWKSNASESGVDTKSRDAITRGPRYRRAVKSRGYVVACH